MLITNTALFAISYIVIMIISLLIGLFIRNKTINSLSAIIFLISALGTAFFIIKYIWEVYG